VALKSALSFAVRVSKNSLMVASRVGSRGLRTLDRHQYFFQVGRRGILTIPFDKTFGYPGVSVGLPQAHTDHTNLQCGYGVKPDRSCQNCPRSRGPHCGRDRLLDFELHAGDMVLFYFVRRLVYAWRHYA
jgi:hypothetical protein